MDFEVLLNEALDEAFNVKSLKKQVGDFAKAGGGGIRDTLASKARAFGNIGIDKDSSHRQNQITRRKERRKMRMADLKLRKAERTKKLKRADDRAIALDKDAVKALGNAKDLTIAGQQRQERKQKLTISRMKLDKERQKKMAASGMTAQERKKAVGGEEAERSEHTGQVLSPVEKLRMDASADTRGKDKAQSIKDKAQSKVEALKQKAAEAKAKRKEERLAKQKASMKQQEENVETRRQNHES